MNLAFVTPKVEGSKPMVEIPTSVVIARAERWKHTLIAYVLGYNPSYFEMEGFVRNRWSEFFMPSSYFSRLGGGYAFRQTKGEFSSNLSSISPSSSGFMDRRSSKCSKCRKFGNNDGSCKVSQEYRPNAHKREYTSEVVTQEVEQISAPVQAVPCPLGNVQTDNPLSPVGSKHSGLVLSPIDEVEEPGRVLKSTYATMVATPAVG
ncbi:hypothetical protein LIER_22306 [Lithospermum erythrorhizon]|uniref:Uncharacterized protein n=1 Tax=Lithospermum erythrorhizon TaxID=34254 RepID=A0AAV3QTK7_LITER